MAPLAVDPEVLSGAGRAVVGVGDVVAAAVGSLVAGFSVNTGQDAAGEVFGLSYQDAAQSLLTAAAAGVDALRLSGAKIAASAANYSAAEAASTLGGGGAVLPTPVPPQPFSAPGPPGTLGPGVAAPLLWAVVQSLVGDLWPNADVAGLHAAAGQWRGFAGVLGGVVDELGGSKAVIAGQDIPEGALMLQVLFEIGADVAQVGEQCQKLAAALDAFASEVGRTQNAIRDLLDRVASVSGLWDQVVSFFEGDLLEEIEEIAADVRAVLHNMGRQARAHEQQMQVVMQLVDDAVVGMQRSVRGQLTRFLGEDVGNPVATVFDTYTNSQEGFLKAGMGTLQGLQQLNPGRFVTDPQGAAQAWKDMTKTGLVNHVLNPQEALEADKEMVSGLLHLEDWRADRPGLGFGGNLFDVATSFFPGAGGAGAGARGAAGVARAGAAGADAAGVAGRGGRVVGEVAGTGGVLGDIGASGRGLTRNLENLGTEVPKFDAPGVGGRPVGMAPEKLPGAPVEPVPRPVESVPAGKPVTETVPGSGAAGRTEVPGGRAQPVPGGGGHPAMGPPGEHAVPAAPIGQPEPGPAGVAPGGSGGVPAPAAAHASSPAAPTAPAAPHPSPPPPVAPSSARPAELAPSHGTTPHGAGDSGPPGGHPPGQHVDGGGPHGAGNGVPPHGHPPEVQPDGNGSSGFSHGSHAGPQDPVHAQEASGAGWHRAADTPTDPHYGEPLPDHWNYPHDPTDLSRIDSDVRNLIDDSDAPFGRDAHGHAYTQGEYEERFNKLGPGGERWYNFPGNDGAIPGTRVVYTDPKQFVQDYGARLDRIGDDGGAYLGVMENGRAASWETRALHVDSLSEPYNAYTLGRLPEGWTVEVSEVAPGLGQPGGSLQARIFDARGEARSVEDLLAPGVLLP
ncbi:DUF4237 domain-containing protein [Mycobacterium spongiae]|uniref:DUF4237 domain-containing protein n=1 Tax=Mycobacterium spongiae TaxID=886343 RepID=A0A975PXK4_9MYCO|nr:DUF4237 domain-containing protein [Mycobacterium spongiae]